MPVSFPSFKSLSHTFRWGLAAAVIGGASFAQAGTPYPHAMTPAARDVGAMELVRDNAHVTVTVALKLRDVDGLQRLVEQIHTPGHPLFRRFLTPAEFHERFSPTRATVDEAVAHFRQSGLTASLESGNLLKVSGPRDAIEQAFNVKLHLFEVTAQGRSASYRFRAPVQEPTIASPTVATHVAAILGLDNQPAYRPRLRHASALAARAKRGAVAAINGERTAAAPINEFGSLTVADVARIYNVQPLYDAGIHGEGRTVGIVTLASFTPADAFTYWSSLGLAVKKNRLSIVNVDGGPGAPSDDSGSEETTLDVQQAGGLAPAAKVIVYQSPNTAQGFVDAFARAINDNKAESVSTSFGTFEFFDTEEIVNVRTGQKKRKIDTLHAFNNLFMQAAAQGQSLFAASGDFGAFDANESSPVPDFSQTLSVDSPASSPWITAAGGTTLPGDQFFFDGKKDVKISIANESVWSEEYLIDFCKGQGLDPIACEIFPVGSGGGVSSFFARPSYQNGVAGIRTTEARQTLVDNTTKPPETVVKLPANFRGRNVPDISLNGDPNTGFQTPYTSDVDGFKIDTFGGGTSFVAPQLNGIAALLGQRVKGRLGLLNFPLYALAATPSGYNGTDAPLRDIKNGSNWFYPGQSGYDLGTGLGTLDVNNLARALLSLDY